MSVPHTHDPFDVFDPWTVPAEEATRARRNGIEREAPPIPFVPIRPQPMPGIPAPFGPAAATESDVAASRGRFSSTGALEPGLVVSASAPEPKRPRWSEGRPTRPVTPPAPPPDPTTQPADFLRKVVVPEFQALARRLEASQHYTSVQDLLDLPTPAVRVLIWPRPGLLDSHGSRILATFELMLDRQASRLKTCFWLGARPGHVIPMAEMSLEKLDQAWVETQVLDFVQKVLDRV